MDLTSWLRVASRSVSVARRGVGLFGGSRGRRGRRALFWLSMMAAILSLAFLALAIGRVLPGGDFLPQSLSDLWHRVVAVPDVRWWPNSP